MKKNPMFPAFKSGLATLLVVSAMLVSCGPKETPKPQTPPAPVLVSLTESTGQKINFEYANGKLSKVIRDRDPDNSFFNYEYNSDGTVKNIVNTFPNENLKINFAFTYENGKLLKVANDYTVFPRLLTFTYNSKEQLYSVYDNRALATNTYTYDAEGNITQIKVDMQNADAILDIEYDKTIQNPLYNMPTVLQASTFNPLLGISGTLIYTSMPAQKYVVKKVISNGTVLRQYSYEKFNSKLIRTSSDNVTATFEFK